MLGGFPDPFWQTHECHSDSNCTNLDGSYNCTCLDGYEGDGYVCVDINECVRGLDMCDYNATCINLNGTYDCEVSANSTNHWTRDLLGDC